MRRIVCRLAIFFVLLSAVVNPLAELLQDSGNEWSKDIERSTKNVEPRREGSVNSKKIKYHFDDGDDDIEIPRDTPSKNRTSGSKGQSLQDVQEEIDGDEREKRTRSGSKKIVGSQIKNDSQRSATKEPEEDEEKYLKPAMRLLSDSTGDASDKTMDRIKDELPSAQVPNRASSSRSANDPPTHKGKRIRKSRKRHHYVNANVNNNVNDITIGSSEQVKRQQKKDGRDSLDTENEKSPLENIKATLNDQEPGTAVDNGPADDVSVTEEPSPRESDRVHVVRDKEASCGVSSTNSVEESQGSSPSTTTDDRPAEKNELNDSTVLTQQILKLLVVEEGTMSSLKMKRLKRLLDELDDEEKKTILRELEGEPNEVILHNTKTTETKVSSAGSKPIMIGITVDQKDPQDSGAPPQEYESDVTPSNDDNQEENKNEVEQATERATEDETTVEVSRDSSTESTPNDKSGEKVNAQSREETKEEKSLERPESAGSIEKETIASRNNIEEKKPAGSLENEVVKGDEVVSVHENSMPIKPADPPTSRGSDENVNIDVNENKVEIASSRRSANLLKFDQAASDLRDRKMKVTSEETSSPPKMRSPRRAKLPNNFEESDMVKDGKANDDDVSVLTKNQKDNRSQSRRRSFSPKLLSVDKNSNAKSSLNFNANANKNDLSAPKRRHLAAGKVGKRRSLQESRGAESNIKEVAEDGVTTTEEIENSVTADGSSEISLKGNTKKNKNSNRNRSVNKNVNENTINIGGRTQVPESVESDVKNTRRSLSVRRPLNRARNANNNTNLNNIRASATDDNDDRDEVQPSRRQLKHPKNMNSNSNSNVNKNSNRNIVESLSRRSSPNRPREVDDAREELAGKEASTRSVNKLDSKRNSSSLHKPHYDYVMRER